ncbi:MAG TPA: hypothetical protein VIH99_02910 [Bdellovibrionota bacterium]|jgi:hypothetical protein
MLKFIAFLVLSSILAIAITVIAEATVFANHPGGPPNACAAHETSVWV